MQFEVTSVSDVMTVLNLQSASHDIEICLSPSSRGGVLVQLNAESVKMEWLATEHGTFEPDVRPSLDDRLFAAIGKAAVSYAWSNLDLISHSLQGTREERLCMLERLAACERSMPPRQQDQGAGTTRLPAPFLMTSPLGRMVVSFGHGNVADIGPADEENPSRVKGCIRFRRHPEYGWRPAEFVEWDIRLWTDLEAQHSMSEVVGILLPMVVMADSLRHEEMSDSGVNGSNIVSDIRALRMQLRRG